MTKRECEQVEKAIDLIHVQDRYEAGMTVLCHLIGKRSIYETMGNKSITMPELMKFFRKHGKKNSRCHIRS